MRSDGAIFKGLAIAPTSGGDRLYATDFHNGKVDVFNEQVPPREHAGGVRGPEHPRGATRRSGSRRRQQDRRHLCEAGRRRRGRRGGRRLRVRRHVRQVREAAPADRLDGCARRAVGDRMGSRQLRRVQRRPADRELRRRHDQRLQAGVERDVRLRGQPAAPKRQRDGDRRGCGRSSSATATRPVPRTACSSPRVRTARTHGLFGSIEAQS